MKSCLAFCLGWLLFAGPASPEETPGRVPSRLSTALPGPGTNALQDLLKSVATETNQWARALRQTEGWEAGLRDTIPEMRAKAVRGEATAQMKLGCLCLVGGGIERDEAEGVKWLTLAAKKGLAPAQFFLGEACLKGLGCEVDFSGGVDWLDQAAAQGLADAEFVLGLCYLSGGPGVNQAPARGLKWLVLAAEQGMGVAQQCAGECYSLGEGARPDPEEAAKWYARAAGEGLATAQNLLAGCYLTGRGVTNDPLQAVRWYRQAAEQGLGSAQASLARCYSGGTGVGKDEREAAKWWERAAQSGFPGAEFHVGMCYYLGQGVTKDQQQAVRCFRKEAEHQHVGALLYLGLCFWRGEGVDRDAFLAAKWWSEACIQGIVPWRYFEGGETLGDAAEVERWWRDIAEHGDPTLQCCLAEFYQFGHGVAQDDLQAAVWYRKAANAGDLVALKRASWLLATSPNPKVRDGASAVKFGEKGASVTNYKDAGILDALAAAYAEAARFENAVAVEKQALACATREDERQEYQDRLKLYQAKTPYRSGT